MDLDEKDAVNHIFNRPKKKIIQPQKLEYRQHLESLDEDKLLEYISSTQFVALFQPAIYLWFQPYLNMSPDLFFEYISKQPISVIQRALHFTKHYEPVKENFSFPVFPAYGDFTSTSIEVYQEVTIKLESILQFHVMKENLPKGQKLKNSGGKI